MTEPKEPAYFGNSDRYRGTPDFTPFLPRPLAPGELLIDATVSMAFDPDLVIPRIQERCGDDVRFIFVLADPVKRALSAYYHVVKYGAERRGVEEVFAELPGKPDALYAFEKERFIAAVRSRSVDLQSKYLFNFDNFAAPFLYATQSLYRQKIARFVEAFGKERVALVTIDQVVKNGPHTFDRLCDFLGIERFERYPDTTRVYNPTVIPAYRLWPRVRRSDAVVGVLRKAHNALDRAGLGALVTRTVPPAPPAVRHRLETVLAEERAFVANLERDGQ